MGTGTKIAIGCGIAAVVGGVVVAAAVFGGLWWVKGKAEEFTSHETRIEELKKRANAVPFSEPSDGVIREDRLVRFLDVRKRIHGVYEKHREALEGMRKKKDGSLRDFTHTVGVVNEVRMAQAQALADVGMSEAEYRFMIEQVYKTLWASESAAGDKTIFDAASDAANESLDGVEKSAGRASEKPGEGALAPRVSPANLALFRKHEADIRTYAMHGLEWFGL